MKMWRHWLKTGSASVLAATRLDRLVAGVTGSDRGPLVVGYHRVVSEFRPDPTVSLASMDISLPMMEAQLEWICSRYRIVSLDELGRALEAGERFERPVAAVTLDDGYRDAYELAFPLLCRYGIPAAFFVVTDLVGSGRVPLHDRLYYQLARGFAREGRVPRAAWRILERLALPPARRDRIARADKPYDALQAVLEAVCHDEARQLTDEMEADAPLPALIAERFRCVSWEMVRTLARAGMTIGSHTRSHTFLNHERPAAVDEELAGSRRRLEAELGRPAVHFAYPAGQFNGSAVRAVAAAG
jgi:peptidoglycan/xylan/chitin deacetylase (PgdA/CDA1 family)